MVARRHRASTVQGCTIASHHARHERRARWCRAKAIQRTAKRKISGIWMTASDSTAPSTSTISSSVRRAAACRRG